MPPRWTKLLFVFLTGAPAAAFGMAKSSSSASAWSTTTTTTTASSSSTTLLSQRHHHPIRRSPAALSKASITTTTTTTSLQAIPRGGSLVAPIVDVAKNWNANPSNLFNVSLLTLALTTTLIKIIQRMGGDSSTSSSMSSQKPASVKALQIRFLSVFWLLRCADWLQGPYFYEVYASKIFKGIPASMGLVSQLFLTGFASTALFGPLVGRAVDARGRKKGTLAFALIYALGAFSTKSPILQLLFVGRILSGIGTSLLFSAPESWLVGESQKSDIDPDGKYLGETFGLAYAGDSIVAIIAGQLAGTAAARRGPTGPFELSTGFLLLGGLLAAFLWKENVAQSSSGNDNKPSIKDAIEVVKEDPKIVLVGGVQSLFEAAMYIFVLQWPPAIAKAVAKKFGEGAGTPYGTVFSCFMACCLLGSTVFGQLAKMSVPTEGFTAVMLTLATIAMSGATYTVGSTMNLTALMASFFAFEACVGMYFPSIGTLRSKYVPDSHRSVIMNLFGIPLNVLVVSVFLSISRLGLKGALGISSGALGVATLCMLRLNAIVGSAKKTKEDSSSGGDAPQTA